MENEQLIKDVIKWIITTKNTEMLDDSDVDLVYADYIKEQVGNVAKPNACPQLCEGWRDATKELPELDVPVIVIIPDVHYPAYAFRANNANEFMVYYVSGVKRCNTVLAWMPLPSPPAFV